MKRKQFLKGVEQIAQEGAIPDLQDPLHRHGGGHRRRGGHPSVRRAGVPPAQRVQRGAVQGGPALRVPALDREGGRGRPPAEGGGPAAPQRRQAGGGLQGQSAAAVRLPVVHPVGGARHQGRPPGGGSAAQNFKNIKSAAPWKLSSAEPLFFIQAWSSSAGPSDGRPGLWPGSSLRRPGSAQRLWPGCSPPSPPCPPWR